MWTKSHNMINWQGRWIETALVNWLHWQTLLCWRGKAHWLFQPDIRYWDIPTCSASPRSGWSQPAAGATTFTTRTVEHNTEEWLSTGHLGRTTSVRDGTTNSFIWWATSIRQSGHWSRPSKWRIGKSWRWSLRTWSVSHLGSESDASTSVCRLASSCRIASLAAGQSGSSWQASGTTFAGRPVTDTRNKGLIWRELCRMKKLCKLCDSNQLNKYRSNYCE